MAIARFNVSLSEDLNNEIDKIAAESDMTKAEILRKSLQLYLAARDAKRKGLKLGFVDANTDQLKTEIVGL